MPLLNIHNLRKSYGPLEVVAGIDLAVKKGECFGLLGPNGAGKTTTLRLALGLTAPDGGTISMLGLPVPDQAREATDAGGGGAADGQPRPRLHGARKPAGLWPLFRPEGCRDRRAHPGPARIRRPEQRADARIDALSGGMKRRLTLARALVNDPDLIFLDEPTTGLDPQARHMMWQGLRRLLNQGKTILLTTHFMEEAERLCDRIAIMDHGKIIATGSPHELIGNHIEPQVVEVYGEGVADWTAAHSSTYCERVEKVGETVFCYTRNSEALVQQLRSRTDLRYLNRPASLEDVFLKLTGRDLRD